MSQEYGYLYNMSNSIVHPKNFLLFSSLWHPSSWSCSVPPAFPCLIHLPSSFSTCFHSHFLSPSLFLLSILFLSHLIFCTLPVTHHVIKHYSYNRLNSVPSNHVNRKFSWLTIYNSAENLNQQCTVVALCSAADKKVRHPVILNTPVI